MEEIKNLFDAIKEVCDENDRLHEENNRLREEIDNKEETIQSWVDQYSARCEFNRQLNKEIIRLRDEMEAMVKDHEAECVDYCIMISERVNIDDLHIILAKYLTDNYTPEPTKICFFQFLDEIKKFIDSSKKEC